MVSRRVRFAGLLTVLGLAGCSAHAAEPVTPAEVSAGPGPSSGPADSRTPLQLLMAGVPTESSPIYHYAIGPDSGVIDPADKIAEFVTVQHFTGPSYTETTTTLLTGAKAWVRIKDVPADPPGLVAVPRKWLLLDSNKIKGEDGKPFRYGAESDPGYTDEIFAGATDATQTGPGHFAGVTDLSDSPAGHVLTAAQLKALGSAAGHLKFTAVLDGQDRLTSTTVEIPAAGKAKATTIVITYDRYGSAAKPKLPSAAETVKAPSWVYDMYK